MRTRHVTLRYVPHDKQRTFHLAPQPIKVAVTGARAGKTIGASAEFVDRCIEQPGYRDVDIRLRKPYTVVAAAPTFRMLERVVLPAVLAACPKEIRLGPYHQTKLLLRLRGMKGETHVYFMNASNPEGWQGQELYGIWIDEFALCKEAMYDEARARLSTCKGWLLMTGTLRRGPGWAQKRIKEYAETTHGREQIALIQWNTLDNPYAPVEQIEEIRRSSPEKYFKRMYEATWDVFEGQIYDELSRETHVFDSSRYTWILPGNRMVGKGEKKIAFLKTAAGVDWGHANPGVIVVAGKAVDGTWYVVAEEYAQGVLVAGHAAVQDSWVARARKLRATWGVETFWCDPESPANAALFRDAGLPARGAYSEVYDGIMTVATLLHADSRTGKPKLYIASSCVHTITEMLGYQWAEGKAEGFREQPVKQNDHSCFVAGTIVETDSGGVPIELVRAGDRVLTRRGYCRVANAGLTDEEADVLTVTFSDGRMLTGTNSHPVYVENVGWQMLDALRYGDIVAALKKEALPCLSKNDRDGQWLSSSTGSSFDAIPTHIGARTGCTTSLRGDIGATGSGDCTKRYGVQHTGRFPRAWSFITWMAIRLTMKSRISAALRALSMRLYTLLRGLRSISKPWRNGLIAFVTLQRHGIDQKPGGDGIQSMARKRGKVEQHENAYASIAVSDTKLGQLMEESGFALTTAKQDGDITRAWIMSRGHARFAESRSPQTSTTSVSTVPVAVRCVRIGKRRQAVYNLAVEGEPEFFANGILVHNCDSLRYLLHSESVAGSFVDEPYYRKTQQRR